MDGDKTQQGPEKKLSLLSKNFSTVQDPFNVLLNFLSINYPVFLSWWMLTGNYFYVYLSHNELKNFVLSCTPLPPQAANPSLIPLPHFVSPGHNKNLASIKT